MTDGIQPPCASRSRAQAIEDGYLVDVTHVAIEAGHVYPVALSRACFLACVAWTDEDNLRQIFQRPEDRLWDLLLMARLATRLGGMDVDCAVQLVPRGGGDTPVRTPLKITLSRGDDGEPVVTISLPDET